jgi:rhodanese-related sulfurtransferase
MNVLKTLFVLGLFLYSTQGCAQHNPDDFISVDDLKKKIKSADSDIIILDVRNDFELKGSLPKIDSALHIPIQEIAGRYNELDKYKDKEILVICRTQNRSSKVSAFLKEKGFRSRFVMGGMQEYHK